MSGEKHLIFGTGPVGCWIARKLIAQNVSVRAINRSGKRPMLMPPEVEMVAADVSNLSEAINVSEGAGVIYQALNPAYHQWHAYFPGLQAGALAAAKASGARYVSIENLYMYDSSKPIHENSLIAPRSKKGELRARLAEEVMAAHARGEISAATLRSSDYYGPGVMGSALGEMVFGNLVNGKKAQLSGSADILHSFAYIEDVGQAAVVLGTNEKAAGKVWLTPHATPHTQGEMVEQACKILGIAPQYSVIKPWMMRLAGLFVPAAKASVEMMYEFTEPFVVESDCMQQTFGLSPTSVETGLQKTLAWYQSQQIQ